MMKIILIGKLLEREFIANVTGNITARYLKFHIKNVNIVGWGKNERFLKILFFIRTHELMTSKIYINIKDPKVTII